jgi:hypothetical protein
VDVKIPKSLYEYLIHSVDSFRGVGYHGFQFMGRRGYFNLVCVDDSEFCGREENIISETYSNGYVYRLTKQKGDRDEFTSGEEKKRKRSGKRGSDKGIKRRECGVV